MARAAKTTSKNDPPHPGALVRELLWRQRLNVTVGATALRVTRVTLSRLLNGQSDLSPDMAVRLEKAFGVNAAKLLRAQLTYDLARLRERAKAIRVPRYERRP